MVPNACIWLYIKQGKGQAKSDKTNRLHRNRGEEGEAGVPETDGKRGQGWTRNRGEEGEASGRATSDNEAKPGTGTF